MACLIMGSVEFEQPELVTFSGDDPNLCLTLAAITHQALENVDPFISSRVEIFGALLLPEAEVRLLMQVSRRLHQAAVLHEFLHESVNFMTDLRGLQYGIFSGGPPLDFSVLEERMILLLLGSSCPSTRRILSRHRHQIQLRYLWHPARHGQPHH